MVVLDMRGLEGAPKMFGILRTPGKASNESVMGCFAEGKCFQKRFLSMVLRSHGAGASRNGASIPELRQVSTEL